MTLLLALLLGVPVANAVDGVIEINATRATAGGVTPSDLPGFPVTLDQSVLEQGGSIRIVLNVSVK